MLYKLLTHAGVNSLAPSLLSRRLLLVSTLTFALGGAVVVPAAAAPNAGYATATPNAPTEIPSQPVSSGSGSVPVLDNSQAYPSPTPPNTIPPPASPAQISAQTSSQAASAAAAGTPAGIQIPSAPPPTSTSFTADANQLAAQAEQAAVQAQAQADIEAQKREQEHNLKSYDKASSGLMPLSPDQVRSFMYKLEQTQNAAQFPYEGTPKGETRISTLSLEPGVQPPQVNLATGFVTTITMVDVTGEPWPILDVGVGGNFEVSPTPAGSHVVRVMPLTRVGTGDLSILLKDLPTPVIFRLAAGGSSVDLRYDARIAKMGPNAKAPIINRPRLEAGDETLTLILENAPPDGAKRLKVGGLDERTKAWSVGDKVYVRTPLSMLSPAWNASVASGDGTNVYEIGSAPVLLMSDNGAMVRAQISQDDEHDR